MSSYADPGGVFESDAHRRVLGHLPLPDDDVAGFYDRNESTAVERVQTDAALELDGDEVESTLSDLEASGYATQAAEGWQMTAAGLEALQAGPADDDAEEVSE
jgi:hypothetical protein